MRTVDTCPSCGTVCEPGEPCPNHKAHPFTFNKYGQPNLWWYLIAWPMIKVFRALHLTVCFLLTVLVYPEEKRKDYWEYYEPLGRKR